MNEQEKIDISIDETIRYESAAFNVGSLMFATIISSLLGIILQSLIAKYFGAGRITDAYFMANNTTTIFFEKLLMMGPLGIVFMPIFIEYLNKKKDKVWKMTNNLFNIITIGTLIVVTIVVIFTPLLVSIMAPGFDTENRVLTIKLVRILFPANIFVLLSTFLISILHSLKQFKFPALISLLLAPIIIITLLLGVTKLGIYSLAYGFMIGNFLQFFLLFIVVSKRGLQYRFSIDLKHPAAKEFIKLMVPFVIGAVAIQLSMIVHNRLASQQNIGDLSALTYATKIYNVVSLIFLTSIAKVFFPTIAHKVSTNDKEDLIDMIGKGLRMTIFIISPVIVGLIILRIPMIRLLFERGSFISKDTQLTALILMVFAIGLIPCGCMSLLSQIPMAFKDSKSIARIGVFSQFIAIGLNFLFVKFWGIAGLALTASVLPIFASSLYFFNLKKRISNLKNIILDTIYIKIIFVSLVMASVCYCIYFYLEKIITQDYLLIGVILFIGFITYTLMSFLSKIQECKIITDIIKKRIFGELLRES